MLQRIKYFFRRWINRIFYRRNPYAVILRNQPNHTDNQGHNNQQQFSSPVEDAVRSIFAPTQSDENYLRFVKIGDDPEVLRNSETIIMERNSLKVIRKRSLVITCSGRTVPPAAIKGRCEITGEYAAELYRTNCCGILICPKHGRVMQFPDGRILVFCKICLKRTLSQWSTWEQGSPPPHYAIVPRGTSQ